MFPAYQPARHTGPQRSGDELVAKAGFALLHLFNICRGLFEYFVIFRIMLHCTARHLQMAGVYAAVAAITVYE